MKLFSFQQIISDVTARFRTIQTNAYKSSGKFQIVDQGKAAIAGYTDDETLVNSQLRPIIVFGDHTRAIKYVDTPIALGADGRAIAC